MPLVLPTNNCLYRVKKFSCLEIIRALLGENPDSIYKVKIGLFVRTLKVHLNNLLYIFSSSLGTMYRNVSQLNSNCDD